MESMFLCEYAGSTFFDRWDYYGYIDDTTWGKCSSRRVFLPSFLLTTMFVHIGNVTYLDQADAVSNRLTYINAAQNAIIKVDNTTTIASAPLVHRNSVRHRL
jgi:hypothetical protein